MVIFTYDRDELTPGEVLTLPTLADKDLVVHTNVRACYLGPATREDYYNYLRSEGIPERKWHALGAGARFMHVSVD